RRLQRGHRVRPPGPPASPGSARPPSQRCLTPSSFRHGRGPGVNPRAITGFGVASSLGIGRQAFLEAYETGASGRRDDGKVESFDAAAYASAPIRLPVAEVRDFDASRYLGDKGLRPLDRLTK